MPAAVSASSSAKDESLQEPLRRQCALVLRLLIVAEFALIGCTWNLWWGTNTFPIVSMSPVPGSAMANIWCSRITLLVFAAAMTGALVRLHTSGGHRMFGGALATAVLLTVLNQQRLQPWHWLFILMILQAILLDGRLLRTSLRLTIVSLYVFSALSRITTEPAGSMSGPIVQTLLNLILPQAQRIDQQTIDWLAFLLTCGEFAAGLLLLIPWTRRGGIVAAILMHTLLLVAFSPVGLDHHPGVLVWNGFLAVCVPLLFMEQRAIPESSHRDELRAPRFLVVATTLILFPLSGLFGLADNWLSWQVYSPRPETIYLLVTTESARLLPPGAQQHVGRPFVLSEWRPVQLDRWSLAAVGVPLYPEDRFLISVIESLTRRIPDGDFRIEMNRPQFPDWWNRSTAAIENRTALISRQQKFIIPSYCLPIDPNPDR